MNQFAETPESSLADAYMQRLGLDDDPFIIETDFFYGGGMRRQILEQVIHFSRFSEQLVLLTGSTGSGTSRILDELFVQLQQTMDCCDINGSESPAPAQILDELNQQLQFQLPWPVSVANFLLALEHNREMTEDEEPLLIAIDQAHFLSVESLEMLSELFEDAAGTVRLLLVGEYQLEQLVGLAGFSPEVLKNIELEPLNEAEAGEYILGLLTSVGYIGEQPLSPDQLAVLQEQSGGNIAEINRLAPLLLSEQPQQSTGGLRARLPLVHFLTIAVLALVLVSIYFYSGSGDELAGSDIGSGSVSIGADEAKVLNGEVGSNKGDEQSGRVTKEFEVSFPSVEDVSDSAGQINRQDAVIGDDEGSALPVKLASPVVDQIVEEVSPALIEAPKESLKDSSGVAKPDLKAEAVEVQNAPLINQSVVIESASVVAPSVAKASDSIQVKVIEKSTIVPREQRLLDMTATDYMLQLMGGLDEQRVRDFVKKYINQLPLTYFETRLNGKPWFVVVTGSYRDKNTALAAIESLPVDLQRQKPWARSVSSIQADIKNR